MDIPVVAIHLEWRLFGKTESCPMFLRERMFNSLISRDYLPLDVSGTDRAIRKLPTDSSDPKWNDVQDVIWIKRSSMPQSLTKRLLY